LELVGSRFISSLDQRVPVQSSFARTGRGVAGEVEIGTPNKSIGHIGAVIRAINESKHRSLD